MKLAFEYTIERPRGEVWALFDDPQTMTRWQPSLRSFEHLSGERGQAGAVSKLTYDEDGREVVMTETVTVRRDQEELSGVYETPFANNTVRNRFFDDGAGGTRWMFEAELEFKGPFKLMGPLMGASIRKRMVADLERFKALAEGRLGGRD